MVTKKEIMKKIEKEKEKIREIGVNKLGLFGSFAKGKQHKKSDVDILVEFRNLNFDDYMKLYYLLSKILKRRVDLVIESDLKPEMTYVMNEVEYVKI